MTLHIPFVNAYAALPDRFYARLAPTPVAAPGLIRVNHALAQELGIDPAALETPEGVAVLAGNAVPAGADPLAQAYAGHQFGGWVPQLGDGRAILLGDIIDSNGLRRDIQLKGAGRTPFSRMGDGRAWLGPVIREYLVSEAMHALGIPTTRALAAVTTGEQVLREAVLPGAVLTRVASSHIRVGTFQYFAARQDTEALRTLTDHVIARHYPGATSPLDLLDRVIARQAELIAAWMAVGFIHGVMNTDNAHVAGETIDYGPCAFVDGYHPDTVFSSIDQFGRYAYARQPEIAVWNMAQFASCLLPLMGEDTEAAIAQATEAVHRFPGLYQEAWLRRFRAKLGLTEARDDDGALIHDLLSLMAAERADFTNVFRGLAEGNARDWMRDRDGFDAWAVRWRARRAAEAATPDAQEAAMRAASPALIPRNHRVEEAIQAAVAGDFAPFHRLTEALGSPFDPAPGTEDLRRPPEPDEVVTRTFCGT
ncbi:MAG: protein adenylyltransferase SelO [Paracoccaceae bacterium]